MHDDPRYHKTRWNDIASFTATLTAKRCVLCLKRYSSVHHAYYGLKLWFIHIWLAGFEIPLWQIFPLCKDCHGIAHRKVNYKEYSVNWRNHNYFWLEWQLRVSGLITLTFVWCLPLKSTGLNPVLFVDGGAIALPEQSALS